MLGIWCFHGGMRQVRRVCSPQKPGGMVIGEEEEKKVEEQRKHSSEWRARSALSHSARTQGLVKWSLQG